MGDNDHYKNGFRKWSSYPLLSRISFLVSLAALVASFLKQS